jgi:heptosyltransferase-2
MMAPARLADPSPDAAYLPMSPAASPSHILVVRGGAIGDFILTLPVLAALRRRYPQARLTLLGRPHIAALAQAGGLADEVRSVEDRRLAGFFVHEGDLDPEFASFFARFDLVVSYLYDPEAVFRQNLARCSRARFIAGPHRPDESLPTHATEVYLKPLEQLGIVGADPVPRFHIGASCPPVATPGPRPAPSVALHPGSGSERKNWPEERWDALIRHLLDATALDVLLVGGEAEGGRLDRLAAGRSSPRLHLARHLPLLDLARCLTGCSAFAGHDSGISHLAAALGLPGVILWGDSAEAVWRPVSDRCILLRDPRGLAGISVSQVLEALESLGNDTDTRIGASIRSTEEKGSPIGSSG